MFYHFKEEANQLLRLPSVLGGEGGWGHVEECRSAFSGDRFGQECLSSAWRSHHEHPLTWQQFTCVSVDRYITKIIQKQLSVNTFHGLRMPLKNAGIHIGSTTASFRSFFASSKSAMSSLQEQVQIRQTLHLKDGTASAQTVRQRLLESFD